MNHTTTVDQMQAHVLQLCETHEISITWQQPRDGAWAIYWFREILIPPIKSSRSYATALHEIGHILGRYQLSWVVLVRERWAWEWARRNALQWTPGMQRYAEHWLSYSERTPRARSNPWPIEGPIQDEPALQAAE
jgi:hypothetical protein